ncbi:hypothetical protein P691DRAFT_793069 [Macrolepiota fuliginosa MF-IS2]|uniref:Mitochondrial carrier n=1 Tax=Macrolepiota fuliginosa MF-IS2 TaxID=1400762 RepID=A0A9P5XMM0_9AGAR|nr:hypothetical protein P691DRAFT_793069 [Macrolepiota fuliginosa MF-IS2]
MSTASLDEALQETDANSTTAEQSASLQAAVARTLTRGMALYFSRPVRLFRPSKISGWQSLKSLAEYQGAVYDHKFLLSVIKLQGFGVFRKHFLPPMIVNAMLGTVLWTTYAETYSVVEPTMQNHPIVGAAVSGGIAGGVQALVAAPAENVRLAIEGGRAGHSWTQAWRSMMRNSPRALQESRGTQLQEVRELRKWMAEVGEMAGRGWSGWGWGCAKDICAFSAFFAIFEVTRRAGQTTKARSENFISYIDRSEAQPVFVKKHVPRILNSIILVSGGVLAGLAYEIICRPWDRARRLIHLGNLEPSRPQLLKPIFDAIRADGLVSFFSGPNYGVPTDTGLRARLTSVTRTLGRVGPWGIGFLVWEMYGPGLS